ncbi:phosphatase PAP2 family protein [Chitinophagaceae bacterium LB-8]|uniref:Phosphatase PAP2 family protein n=1 Tax=Paraflavisolibacter caeni TaxID=2982496 RepID=A0A9X2XYU4_9BACT|nr:phosphatase PAP2 family protein [Paraflavisolibacter caeni]MCU7552079.1 phosphatase PAP2 family protein [Paraflavisolibacter caeni]
MIRKVREKIGKVWASVALLSIEIIVVGALFLGAFTGFVFMVRRVFHLHDTKLDYEVFNYLSKHVNGTNNSIMLGITFLGRHEFLIPANLFLIFYFLVVKKHKWYSIKVPAIALSSLALMFLLKHLFGRERPLTPLLEEAKGMSFPSGHALMSVTFYGLLIYIIWQSVKNKKLRLALTFALILLILLIGFSRIYLRVHYTTDVIAGFCMGFLWLVVSIWVVDQFEKFSKRKVSPIVENPTKPIGIEQ